MLLLYAERSTGYTDGGWDVRWGGKETKGRKPHKPIATVDKWSFMPLGHSERKSRTWLRYPQKEVGGWGLSPRRSLLTCVDSHLSDTWTWMSQVCCVGQTATPQTEAPWTAVAAFSRKRVVPWAGHCGILLLSCTSWHAERGGVLVMRVGQTLLCRMWWRERYPCSKISFLQERFRNFYIQTCSH